MNHIVREREKQNEIDERDKRNTVGKIEEHKENECDEREREKVGQERFRLKKRETIE